MFKLSYTDAHVDFRKRLRTFLKSEVVPHIDRWEKDHCVPREIWHRMGREGFLCTAVSQAYGGLGGDFLYSVIVVEEIARTNSTGLIALLHSDVVVPYIDSFGTVEQKERYLPSCVDGSILTAVAMTEPDAGSDLASMTSTAVLDADHVVINGAKTFISNGINCDLVVVAAKDPSEKTAHKAISLYLVEDGTPGFKKGNRINKMGMHSQDTAELFFANCRIPVANRLGEAGAGFKMLMQKLQQERLICSIWPMAIAENLLAWTVDYCRRTEHNQKPLSAHQAVQFDLVEMETELRIGRSYLNDLILAHDAKQQVVAKTSMAKYWMTQKSNEVANRCLDLVGAFATTEACPIVRTWRDVRVQTIFAGTNEIMKNIIAKSMHL